MFHGFRLKDLLKDPLPFKDKGGFPTFKQLSVELRDNDFSLVDLESQAHELTSEFRSRFRAGTNLRYYLGVSGYSAGGGYRGIRIMWRKRGVNGRNPFVAISSFIDEIDDPTVRQIYDEFEQRRLMWQLFFNLALTHRRGLDSFQGFYQLPSVN